jgi:hypothetical protein
MEKFLIITELELSDFLVPETVNRFLHISTRIYKTILSRGEAYVVSVKVIFSKA